MPAADNSGKSTKRKPPVAPSSPPPVTDVQSSGGNYGLPKAKAYKRTPEYKQTVAAVKPRRIAPDANVGSDLARANAFKKSQEFAKAVDDAKHQLAQQIAGSKPNWSDPVIKNLAAEGRIKRIGGYAAKGDTEVMSDAVHAPVLKILDQLTRVNHGIAGAADAAVTGRNVPQALGRGLQNKDKTTFTNVLQHVGVPKALAAPAGFGLDVVTDPTTYVTFGAGSIGSRVAAGEAARVAEKAAAAGMSEAGQRTVANAAVRRLAVDPSKGVTAKFAGREIPGVLKATTAAGRAVKGGASRAPQALKDIGRGAHAVVREFHPSLKPVGAAPTQWADTKAASVQARASANQVAQNAARQADELRKQLGEDRYGRVIQAIETQKVASLKATDPELHQAAVFLRSVYRHSLRVRRQSGENIGDVTKIRGRDVPGLTADPSETAKELAKARRQVAAADREHAAALQDLALHQGRAEVLSRNVNGGAGERAAQGASVVQRLAESRAGRSAPPADVLRHIDTVMNRVEGYGGGGQGVAAARERVAAAAAGRDSASLVERAMAGKHAAEKAAAAAQRAAAEKALKQSLRAEGAARGFFPHVRLLDEHGDPIRNPHDVAATAPVEPPLPHSRSGQGMSVRDTGSRKARGDLRPVHAQNADGQVLSTNIPAIHMGYQADTGHVVSQNRYLQQIADAGKDLHLPGKPGAVPGREDAVLHLTRGKTGNRLRVVPSSEYTRVMDGNAPASGRYVVLNKHIVDDVVRGEQAGSKSQTGKGFDALTRGFKMTAVATPGFHARNAVGDTWMAYTNQPGHKLVGNAAAAIKPLRALSKDERNPLGATSAAEGQTIKVAGKPMPMPEFLKLASDHGVVRTGISRDMQDTAQGAGRGANRTKADVRGPAKAVRVAVRKKAHGGNVKLQRAFQNREDWMRLATFKHQLDLGKTPAAAAAESLRTHIDYQDVSGLERKALRRVAPFYTFTSRALPQQTRALVTHPGKFANLQKARETSAKAAGFKDADAADAAIQDYVQRQLPIITGLLGKATALSAQLPANLLNELPTTLSPSKYAQEVGNFAAGLANPLFKAPTELLANRSFYTRRDINDPNAPLVAAPAWVKLLPAAAQKKLGVTFMIDKKSGDRVPAWPGKSDYVVHLFPGPVNLANQIATKGVNRRGQNANAKIASGVIGIKADPVSLVDRQISDLFTELKPLQLRARAFSQQGVGAANPTKEYVANKTRLADVQKQLAVLTRHRGDVVPYGASRQEVARRKGLPVASKPAPSRPGAASSPQELLIQAAERNAQAAGPSPEQMQLLIDAATRQAQP